MKPSMVALILALTLAVGVLSGCEKRRDPASAGSFFNLRTGGDVQQGELE